MGGKLVLSTRKIFVSGPVDKLPDEITVDVTTLGVGKTIFVGDLKSDDLKFLTPATTAVCAVRVTRASRGRRSGGRPVAVAPEPKRLSKPINSGR